MSSMPRGAEFRYTAFGEGRITWPYCPPMLEDLKAAIPYRFRNWDPTGKVWTIDPAYVDVAIAVLLHHFPDASVPRRGRTDTTTNSAPAGNDPFALLHLLPSAPREVIDASFRALAKSCHPDRGGTDARMRELIAAHEALSRRLSA
jgi:hypothetical protein